MISVVILNRLRPGNLTGEILPPHQRQPLVGDIIICHANPHRAFSYSTPLAEVRNLDYSGGINAEYG